MDHPIQNLLIMGTQRGVFQLAKQMRQLKHKHEKTEVEVNQSKGDLGQDYGFAKKCRHSIKNSLV